MAGFGQEWTLKCGPQNETRMPIRKQITGWPSNAWLRGLAVALLFVTAVSASLFIFSNQVPLAMFLALFNTFLARFLWRRSAGKGAWLVHTGFKVDESTDPDEAEKLEFGAAGVATVIIVVTAALPWLK